MIIKGVTETTTCFLREEIVTGTILPGTKLNEIELAEKYGVSRPPLREAFRKLEYEKLVMTIPRKGTYVTDISIEDCKQLYLTRRVLECGAIDIIAKNNIQDFRRLKKYIHDVKAMTISRNAEPIDLMTSFDGVTNFHMLLLETSGNRWLIHCYQNISATLTRYQHIYFSIPGTRQPSIENHITILSLLEKTKFQEAKTLLLEHIDNSFYNLLKTMKKAKIIT